MHVTWHPVILKQVCQFFFVSRKLTTILTHHQTKYIRNIMTTLNFYFDTVCDTFERFCDVETMKQTWKACKMLKSLFSLQNLQCTKFKLPYLSKEILILMDYSNLISEITILLALKCKGNSLRDNLTSSKKLAEKSLVWVALT